MHKLFGNRCLGGYFCFFVAVLLSAVSDVKHDPCSLSLLAWGSLLLNIHEP